MRFSDIQLSDKELLFQTKDWWSQRKYARILSLYQNEQLDKKVLNAKSLNDLTDYVVQLEKAGKDETFKAYKIKVSRKYPTDLEVGKVFFKWTDPGPYIFNEVNDFKYTFNDVDVLNITWSQVDGGDW